MSNEFASTSCCSTAVCNGLHNASVSPSRNIASSRTGSNIARYVFFARNVTTVGDISDVTSVNTVLQQCTGKVVRLNIQFEITYSTTVVGFYTTMLLVVLMERCNFVSAGIETEATGHLTYRQLVKGSALTLLKQASWSSG